MIIIYNFVHPIETPQRSQRRSGPLPCANRFIFNKSMLVDIISVSLQKKTCNLTILEQSTLRQELIVI